MIQVTKPPDNYITPKDFEVAALRKQLQIPDDAVSDLNLQDISNMYANGSFVDPVELDSIIKPRIDKDLGWKVDKKGRWTSSTYNAHWADRKDASNWLREKMTADANRRLGGLRKLKLEKVPGDSPLARACFLTKMIKGEELTSELADSINETLETLSKLTPEEIQLMESTRSVDTKVDSPEAKTDLVLKKMEIATDMDRDQINIWLQISKLLEHSPHFLSFRETEIKADVEGEEVRIRQIASIDEIDKLSAHEWALPESLLHYEIASQTATVREHITRIEKKQLLYLLVDSSGSMAGSNQYKAGGVVMNRMKAVLKGDAVCYLRFFAGSLEANRHYAHDEKTAKEVMDFIKEHNFNGGDTCITEAIQGCVKDIDSMMNNDKLLVRPELVIITDGEGCVDITAKDLGQTKLHAIVFGDKNYELDNLARSSGGISVIL